VWLFVACGDCYACFSYACCTACGHPGNDIKVNAAEADMAAGDRAASRAMRRVSGVVGRTLWLCLLQCARSSRQ
jgi:hypothetical protein